MTREELRCDCRKIADEFYLTHSIEQVIDKLAELMARNAEISQSLDLLNQQLATERSRADYAWQNTREIDKARMKAKTLLKQFAS